MKLTTCLLAAALPLAACTQPAATTTATAPPATTAAATFVVGNLAEGDGQIQGCTTMLSRAGDAPSAGDLFRAGGGDDKDVQGFIRIDGALITLNLVTADIDEKGGRRSFADTAHTTQVIESLTTGAAHEESDSVEESGTLAVTHNGATQTLQVSGGTAC